MKKPFIYLLTAGLAVSMFANTGTTYAVGTDSSEASVNFSLPVGTVDPVDPENPENPNEEIDVDSGNNTEQTGPLSLDYISHINFGSHDISYLNEELTDGKVVINSLTNRPYVQVTDNRGYGEGWTLSAEATSFTVTDDEGTTIPTLPAAEIKFSSGDTTSATDSSINSPSVEQNIVLSTNGGENTIASAVARTEEAGSIPTGLGTWVVRWLNEGTVENEDGVIENEKITLEIPSIDVTEGNHTATINWTLSDVPGVPGQE